MNEDYIDYLEGKVDVAISNSIKGEFNLSRKGNKYDKVLCNKHVQQRSSHSNSKRTLGCNGAGKSVVS
jgi:hypothetical protein